jgi:predicted enzyme related to lactoylglutathione lyase
MSKHPIVHIEFSTKDRKESGKFYNELFGWNVQQMPEMDYAMFESGEGVGGGLNPVTEGFPAGRGHPRKSRVPRRKNGRSKI